MKEVFAKNGERAIISDEDYPEIARHTWWTSAKRSSNGGFYFFTQVKGKTIYMHRMVMQATRGVEVDHINGDASDNRRDNLRLATRAQNCVNRTDYKPASGYRGVYRQPSGKSWAVKISVGGKFIRGGNFTDKTEAAERYDALASEHFGEFAVLNFPENTGV